MYKPAIAIKVFFIFAIFLFLLIDITTISLGEEIPFFMRLLLRSIILIFILIFFIVCRTKLIIYEDRVEFIVSHLFKIIKKNFLWNEIVELKSSYFLYPENGDITLVSLKHLSKKSLWIPITAFPLQALKDILSHLPPDTKVYLYPYLKRKLEGKQTWFYNAPDEMTTAKEIVERNKIGEQQRSEGEAKKTAGVNILRAIITSDSFKEVFGVIAILAIGIVVGMLVIFGIYLVYSKLF